MRLDQQNRRSCIVLLIVLAALIGLVIWMSLGGVSSEGTGNAEGGVMPAAPAS